MFAVTLTGCRSYDFTVYPINQIWNTTVPWNLVIPSWMSSFIFVFIDWCVCYHYITDMNLVVVFVFHSLCWPWLTWTSWYLCWPWLTWTSCYPTPLDFQLKGNKHVLLNIWILLHDLDINVNKTLCNLKIKAKAFHCSKKRDFANMWKALPWRSHFTKRRCTRYNIMW